MNEWYENESEDALESEREGEEEGHFARSSRSPPARRTRALHPGTRRFGARRGMMGAPRAQVWRSSGSRLARAWQGPAQGQGPRQGRRWPRVRPWVLYGGGPYGYGYPLNPPPPSEPPPEDADPGASAQPAPDVAPPEEPSDAPPGQDGPPPAESQELEAQRGPVSAKVLSWSVRKIDRHPFSTLPAGGGLYVVEEEGLPLYVGETDSFQGRWRGRLLSLYQMGLTQKGGLLPKPITVWFGTIQPNTRQARRAVEHALIRALLLSGAVPAGRLRNLSSIRQFRVKGGVSIQGLLPPNTWGVRAAKAPGIANRALSLPDKALYELFER